MGRERRRKERTKGVIEKHRRGERRREGERERKRE